MGKKAKAKLLRRIAEQLPPMQEQAFERKIVSGLDLYTQSKEAAYNGYDPSKQYIQRTKLVPVPVNHARRMKKLSREFGMKGAVSYAMMEQERYQAEQQLQEAAKAPAPPTETEKAP